MSKFKKAVSCAAAGLMLLFSVSAQAGEVDVLLDILVKKGVLTASEASIVRDETKQAVAAELAAQKSYAVPSWAQKTKIKGDFRLRYQRQSKKSTNDRHRGRYRFRLGIESQIAKKFMVGAGLATGGTDPRSTNQTFTNSFETPDIRMDYAYMKYSPLSYLQVYAGKMPRKPVLWAPSDLLWDGDINPEGGSLVFNYNLTDDIGFFFNGGVWVLDESSSDSSDPYLKYLQPGFTFGFANGISLKTALTYYRFDSIEGSLLDHSAGTNTLDVNGNLASSFTSLNPAAELAVKEPFDGLVPYASIFGEFVTNLDDDHVRETEGWLAGFKVGDKSVKKPGQWQFKYMFRNLEMDAFPDVFPDSDSYGGETNIRGHEWVVEYGIANNVVLGLDYYRMNQILGGDDPEHLFQTDVVIKF